MTISLPTPEKVRELPYVELLARLGESNRPPGGIDTVRRLIVNCHLRPGMRVLHAGCNAGFLSRELARLAGCNVLGIDISRAMVAAANERAAQEHLSHLVQHENHDMRTMHLDGRSFDVVLSGGALAFVEGQRQAVEQWIQVARPGGLLADAELYYRDLPPHHILDAVSTAIGVPVPRYDRGYWASLFTHELLEPYYQYEQSVRVYTDDEVKRYCQRMVTFAAEPWSPASQSALYDRLVDLFSLFNENLTYMNYTVFVYRRVTENAEPALFM